MKIHKRQKKRKLSVSSTLISDQAMIPIIQKHHSSLTELDISFCRFISDATLAILTEKSGGVLTQFFCNGCTLITEESFDPFVDQHYDSLEKLGIAKCDFVDETLYGIIENCYHLSFLDLSCKSHPSTS